MSKVFPALMYQLRTAAALALCTLALRPCAAERPHQNRMARLGAVPSHQSQLEDVNIAFAPSGVAKLSAYPRFSSELGNRFAAQTPRGEIVYFTVDPKLQRYVEGIVAKSRAPHTAIVVMDPSNGRVLAMAGKSRTLPNILAHAGFPAASIFKIVTAAGALERRAIGPASPIAFRGGNYTLSTANYRPDAKRDRRVMGVGEAMGKSCNPVFGRIALRFLSPSSLRWYAESFGFNEDIEFDVPLPVSRAKIPDDDYGLSRTGAGFGEVYMSPIHAASLVSGVANSGLLPRPTLIDSIVAPSGSVLYQSKREMLKRMVSGTTAESLLSMMKYTTTVGTSRKEFTAKSRPALGALSVAAKTGTLSGDSPAGVNNWFVAAAPAGNPKVAVAVIVVKQDGPSTKASYLGRLVLERYFNIEPAAAPAHPIRTASKTYASKKKRWSRSG